MKGFKTTIAVALAATAAFSAFAGQLRLREQGMFAADRMQSGGRASKKAGGFAASDAAVKAVVALRDRLGIAADASDLGVRRADVDAFGRTHVRLRQLFGGVEVDGRELIVHFDAAGSVYEVNGDWLDTGALAAFPAPSVKVAGATPVVYCRGDDASAARLAWRSVRGRRIVFTDAQTGETLHVRRAAPHAFSSSDDDDDDGIELDADKLIKFATDLALPSGAAATVKGRLPSQQGGAEVESVATLGADGATNLVGKTKGGVEFGVLDGIASPKIREGAKAANAGKVDWTGEFLAQTGWTRWSDDPDEDMPNSLAIMHNVATVLDYYQSAFGRLSYDGKGGRVASWRFWQEEGDDLDYGYANAFWISMGETGAPKEKGCFFFGYDLTGKRSETALDCCAHELTHGVTTWSANLEYEGESGALNESFSDLVAAACEFAALPRAADVLNPAPGEADWLFDEDSGETARSYADPQLYDQPSRYRGRKWVGTADTSEDNDYGGVHSNSGVQNHFFYLLCEGGRGENDGIEYDLVGIGVEKAAQLAYLTLTAYCGPRTDYAAVTSCWDSAALDLVASGVLTEEDYAAVQPAWNAVMAPMAEFSSAGENLYAGDLGDGSVLVVKTGKANAKGAFKVVATLYDGKKKITFKGMADKNSATLSNRRYEDLELTLGADSAEARFGGVSGVYPISRISPSIAEIEGLDALRVGVAAHSGPLAIDGNAVKVVYSAKGLPRGVRLRKGIVLGVPTKRGEGETTVYARCTVVVPGLGRKVKVKVASRVPWLVSALDGYARGKFAGDGMSLTVSKIGKIGGYVVLDGVRVRLYVKSYKSFDDGVYKADRSLRRVEWSLIVAEDGATVIASTAAGIKVFTAPKVQ